MPEDDGNVVGESDRQDFLQHGPDQVLRAQAIEDLRETIVVGKMREARIQEAGILARQHLLLNIRTSLIKNRSARR